MTIINRSLGFIYIHVPKTAGTSLKLYLTRFCEREDICLTKNIHTEGAPGESLVLRKHSSAEEIREYMGEEEFKKYFKFSIVRNPFERANSIFHFLKFKFRNWPKSAIMDRFSSLEDMVVSDFFRRPGPGGIFEPQTSWLMIEGMLMTNFLARLETFEADLAEIFSRLSLGEISRPIERMNASQLANHESSVPLTPAAADAILSRYAADFEILGYCPDPSRKLDPPTKNRAREATNSGMMPSQENRRPDICHPPSKTSRQI